MTTGHTDKIIVCIGRKANRDGLGLESLGVETDRGGWVKADPMLRTSAKDVYAIGDLLGPARVMPAHVASTEGEIAVENFFRCRYR